MPPGPPCIRYTKAGPKSAQRMPHPSLIAASSSAHVAMSSLTRWNISRQTASCMRFMTKPGASRRTRSGRLPRRW